MELKIVADESVDYRIVAELRKIGLEVLAICEDQPSIKDEDVLAIAVNNDAILITEDKDFGELVFRLQLPHNGILLIRIADPNSKIVKVAEAIANYYKELYGKFAVIDEKKLRIKE
jgi:predicted nuclease of predicted toxin-antitoxin system